MSTTIEINQKQLNSKKLQVHFLPAKIEGDGNANVEDYFNNYIREENGYLENALRGYRLQGTERTVPAGFKALVLQEPPSQNEKRTMRIRGSFEKFTYWNYDKFPTKADAYMQALQWNDIATHLATPITNEELESYMEKNKTAS